MQELLNVIRFFSNPLVFLVISIVVILLVRVIVLWYWRIHDIIRLQQENNQLLENMIELLRKQKNP
jgi:hypothetical protein